MVIVGMCSSTEHCGELPRMAYGHLLGGQAGDPGHCWCAGGLYMVSESALRRPSQAFQLGFHIAAFPFVQDVFTLFFWPRLTPFRQLAEHELKGVCGSPLPFCKATLHFRLSETFYWPIAGYCLVLLLVLSGLFPDCRQHFSIILPSTGTSVSVINLYGVTFTCSMN